MEIREEVRYWEAEYFSLFKKDVPTLPMMVSKNSDWYASLVASAVKKKEEITKEKLDKVVKNLGIEADLITNEEEKEDGDKN